MKYQEVDNTFQFDHLITIAQIDVVSKLKMLSALTGIEDPIRRVIEDVVKIDPLMKNLMGMTSDTSHADYKNVVFEMVKQSPDWPLMEKLADAGYDKGDLLNIWTQSRRIATCQCVVDQLVKLNPVFKALTKWEVMLYIHYSIGIRMQPSMAPRRNGDSK